MMQVSVTFRHMDPTQSLKEFAAEKVSRIKKYVNTPGDAHVVLSVEKYMHKADITISAHGMTMRGEDKSDDMYASIDKAMGKIERQVRRYKDRLNSRSTKGGKAARFRLNVIENAEHATPAARQDPSADARVLPPEIIESKEVSAQRMSIEEAIMQMDLMNNGFLVFVNDRNSLVSVLYRRNDGKFGLIETPA